MKQLTDSQLINLLSVGLGLTFALSGVMIYYFRNEIQFLVKCLNQSFKREQETLNEWYEKLKDSNDDNLRLIKEKQSYINLYEKLFKLHFEVCSKFEKLKEHNKKYSTICRKLYDENYNLKFENKHLEEKCKNRSLEIEELKLQVENLNKNKLKERKKK